MNDFAAGSGCNRAQDEAGNPGPPRPLPGRAYMETRRGVGCRRRRFSWRPAPGPVHGHPVQCPHEDRLLERELAEGAPAAVTQWLADASPDIVALQETKLEDAKFPAAELAAAGYRSVYSAQKTYNG